MEDEAYPPGPPMDTMLRRVALQQAIARCSDMRIELGPQDVVAVAQIFYQFLKGETK